MCNECVWMLFLPSGTAGESTQIEFVAASRRWRVTLQICCRRQAGLHHGLALFRLLWVLFRLSFVSLSMMNPRRRPSANFNTREPLHFDALGAYVSCVSAVAGTRMSRPIPCVR